jgi:predicted ATPase with chaperone activity
MTCRPLTSVSAAGSFGTSNPMLPSPLARRSAMGNASLTERVRSVKRLLAVALRAKAEGKSGLLVPRDNAAEAAVVKGLQVIPIRNLREAVGFLEGEVKISPTRVDLDKLFDQPCEDELDFADVKGQEAVKREVPAVKFREITAERTGEASAPIRERVVAARQRQHERFHGKPRVSCNARMGTRELKA